MVPLAQAHDTSERVEAGMTVHKNWIEKLSSIKV